ncbi:MAG: hypothetical protein K1X83_04475 [Oligoflexia bacterium]|nr:hypothetical protein [Oligoflexia bacterium]
MSFWDPKYLEEQRKRRMEEERRRRLESEAAARRREAARQQQAKKAKLLKAKKLKEREEELEAANELGEEAQLKEDAAKPKEPFVPPVLNRGFGFAPGSAPMSAEAQATLKKNEIERQKKAVEDQSAARSEDPYNGPKLARPF